VTGSSGQLGSELITELAKIYGLDNIITADIHQPQNHDLEFQFITLDVINKDLLEDTVKKYSITQIYHLAAILSATGEKHPGLAWQVNIEGLMNVLDVSRNMDVKKVFWPSSIAIFGPKTPRIKTPQHTITDPNTVYGISKLTGERLIEYYYDHFGLDVRSLRYPGLIGYKSLPGGGTTDYAVEIFHKAILEERFSCFLKQNTSLPMMYMPDAVRATLEIMEATAERMKIRSSYNIAAVSFSPEEIANSVKRFYPEFEMDYKPDFRQDIAKSWPKSIDDTPARIDWEWQHEYDLDKMTEDMILHLKEMLVKENT